MLKEERKKLTKIDLFSILTAIFCTCLIISNLLASKTFILYEDIILPCSIIVYPVIYVVNDVLAEIYGYNKTKRVIYLGFILNLFAVILYHISIALPSPEGNIENEAFNILLGTSFKILFASFTGYLFGSLINSYVMVWLKEKLENLLFFRCVVSTICGESVDSTIFLTILFIGVVPLPILAMMILSQTFLKVSYEILIYPATRKTINYIKKLPT
jgi:uncharacterized integral membrane protein (TIGR00697 family)